MREDVGHGMTVVRADDADLAWSAERFCVSRWPLDTQAIAVLRGSERKCVIIYNLFAGRGCMTHIVSDGSRDWATRGVLYAMCAYPFIQLGLDFVMGMTPVSNIRALVFNLKLGWEIEGRVRGTSDSGEDEILFTMRRERCRWIKEPPHVG